MKIYYKSLFVAVITALFIHGAQAQSVTFDFDNAPQYAPLPLDLTAGGITGHFSSGSPFYNYSIQAADVLGFTPPGFAGLCVYPSTVFASDLLVSFDRQLTSASILYSPEEYGTDSSCTMRMTAYLGTTYVGTNTHQIPHGGTWPSGTLSFSSTSPFDNIVIHYDAPPPTGGDYGPIFMADNLVVTPSVITNPPTVVSRKTHSTAGTFDIPMPLTGPSGVEDRLGGNSGKHSIVFTYTTSPVGVTASVTAHDPPGATGLVTRVQVSGNDLIVTLNQVSNAQVLTLTTSGGTVSPVSVPIGFLIGDVDASRLVDQSDLSLTRAQMGQPITATNFWMDVKPSGGIDNIDMRQVKNARGTSIP
jgi:hypothetical protein